MNFAWHDGASNLTWRSSSRSISRFCSRICSTTLSYSVLSTVCAARRRAWLVHRSLSPE
jgi:hypothetical protein